jgi:hypothetical protein
MVRKPLLATPAAWGTSPGVNDQLRWVAGMALPVNGSSEIECSHWPPWDGFTRGVLTHKLVAFSHVQILSDRRHAPYCIAFFAPTLNPVHRGRAARCRYIPWAPLYCTCGIPMSRRDLTSLWLQQRLSLSLSLGQLDAWARFHAYGMRPHSFDPFAVHVVCSAAHKIILSPSPSLFVCTPSGPGCDLRSAGSRMLYSSTAIYCVALMFGVAGCCR